MEDKLNLSKIFNILATNFKVEMSFKFDFFSDLILGAIYNIFLLLVFKIIFSHIKYLPDWTYQDLFIAFLIYNSIIYFLESIIESISEAFNTIYDGKFDPFLCKPLSIQFLIIFYFFKPTRILLSLFIILFTYTYIFNLGYFESTLDFLCFSFSLFLILMINIFFIFILNSMTLVSERALHLEVVHHFIMELCFIPPKIYGEKLLNLILIFIPVILTSSLPVLILVYNKYSLLYLLILTFFLFLFITIFIFKNLSKFIKNFGG
jgi:ABC-type uncharacterized transport system permease subunit